MNVETDSGQTGKMNPDIEKIIYLQTVDSDIARKQNLLITLPEEISQHGATTEAAKQKLKEFDDQTEAFQKQRRELESEVEEVKLKISTSKTHLPTVKTNVEYRAIIKEEETLNKMIDKLEEKQLDLMEKQDGREAERKPLEEAFKKEDNEFQVIKREKEAAIAEVKETLDKLLNERKELIGDITPSVYSTYQKVANARQGIGVAKVKDMLCKGCRQIIPPAEYYVIKSSDELHRCPHCTRYIYFDHSEVEAEEEK